MGKKLYLSGSERDFFSLVNRAIIANPFSDERIQLDLEIAHIPDSYPIEERTVKIIDAVSAHTQKMEKEGAKFTHYAGEDYILVKNTFLFEFFLRFIDKFDQLILAQIEAGDRPIKVAFAHEAFSFLEKRGFMAEEIHRYFALCYQLRRAFFFIYSNLVGRSPCMKELRKNLWNNVFTHDLGVYDHYLWNRMEDFSTLILGETGTGKGTAAMAIGRSGFIPFNLQKEYFVQSFTQSFVSLNLSQFPESLLESELFGHKKGAFTGAIEDYKGVFSSCSPYGAIFLDEIGEVTIPVQIKLLRVLQERIFSPVGSHQKERFEGRVIAATNRPIQEIRQKKVFRDDFFYRLCSDVIIVPTLKQRIQEDPDELNDLIDHTVTQMLRESSQELIQLVLDVIGTQVGRKYAWPGNVRELEQCVRRVLLKRSYEGDYKSTAPDLRAQLMEDMSNERLNAQEIIAGYCALLYARYGTFEEVARKTNLDRRTVKKYINEWKKE